MPDTNALSTVAANLTTLQHDVLDYAIFLAAVGTVVMAFIELIKSLFDLRLKFHKWRIKKWIEHKDARGELLLLASGGASAKSECGSFRRWAIGEVALADAIYDQPTEKMLGQIQAATNLILDFPAEYPHAYDFIAGPLADDTTSKHSDAWKDSEAWKTAAEKMARGDHMGEPDRRKATQARARLGNLVSRRLDGFQNATQYLWAELNQRAAFILGASLILGLAQYAPAEAKLDWLKAILFAGLGGLIAPFAKDIVSALSGLKTKRD